MIIFEYELVLSSSFLHRPIVKFIETFCFLRMSATPDLRAALHQKLIESGEKERLKEHLRAR